MLMSRRNRDDTVRDYGKQGIKSTKKCYEPDWVSV